jgi:hypothetical protein
MAYPDFTLIKFKQAFRIESASVQLFTTKNVKSIRPSQRLREDIKEAETLPIVTEKAKSELIITPIIKELKRRNPSFSFFSGFTFSVDASVGLTGVPDFILTRTTENLIEIEAPIFCLVEAKNGIVEEGIGQCAAEMYASRLFNQQMGKPYETIYGAVTNAFDWVFLKLEDNTIYVDQDRYFLNNLPRLIGILQHIIDEFTENTPPQ